MWDLLSCNLSNLLYCLCLRNLLDLLPFFLEGGIICMFPQPLQTKNFHFRLLAPSSVLGLCTSLTRMMPVQQPL